MYTLEPSCDFKKRAWLDCGVHSREYKSRFDYLRARCCFAANVCTCNHGVALIGPQCPANGAAKCASCASGFTLAHDKTQCIGECTVRTCVRIHCSPKLLYARICVMNLQQMSAYAIIALRQLAPIAPSMVIQSACRAALDSPSTMTKRSVFLTEKSRSICVRTHVCLSISRQTHLTLVILTKLNVTAKLAVSEWVSEWVCVCVCMCVCVWLRVMAVVFVYMCAWQLQWRGVFCIYVCMTAKMAVSAYVCMRVPTCMSVWVRCCAYACVCICIYIYICIVVSLDVFCSAASNDESVSTQKHTSVLTISYRSYIFFFIHKVDTLEC